MRKLHIGTSPLTNRIFVGHVLKDGCTWGEGKQDVTGVACGAVAEHVIANGGPVVVTRNNKPKFEINVRDLDTQDNRADAFSRLDTCRNYLMSTPADEITVEDALEALGFGRNGLGA